MKARRSAITALVVVIGALAALGVANWWFHHDRSAVDQTKSVDNSAAEQSAVKPKQPLALYYIGVGDNGVTGEKIGCDDSVIRVNTAAVATDNVLKDTFDKLLAGRDQTLPGSGFYNALAASRLVYQSGGVDGNTVTVRLVGTLSQGGECDAPRIKAQLEQTALEAAGAKRAAIYINGESLDSALSLK